MAGNKSARGGKVMSQAEKKKIFPAEHPCHQKAE